MPTNALGAPKAPRDDLIMNISLQLGRAEVLARAACGRAGITARVVSSKWIGNVCKTETYRFRIAEVILEDEIGNRITKQITLQSNLGYRIV